MTVVAAYAPELSLTANLAGSAWRDVPPLAIDRTWRGTPAPAGLDTRVRAAWTASHLWFAFDCGYVELDADDAVDRGVKRTGLWDRDVCEAFVRSPREPHAGSYKELEVAPTGQWCDLAVHRPRLDVDLGWPSGMETAAVVDAAARRFVAVMRIPFTAFGGTPVAGETWALNLFRIARVKGERQYLSLSPTNTPEPDFHVPDAFVPLVFASA